MLCCSTSAWAADLGIGVSASRLEFSIYKNDGTTQIATLKGTTDILPYISVNTDQDFFGDSNWGYYFYAGYAKGEINKTTKDGQYINSEIETSIIYAGASIFYAFGGKLSVIDKGTQHMVGLGYGAGLLKASGTVPADFTTTGSTEYVDISDTGLAVNVYYRYINNGWFFEADVRGVRASNGAKEYGTSTGGISFGKRFDLHL